MAELAVIPSFSETFDSGLSTTQLCEEETRKIEQRVADYGEDDGDEAALPFSADIREKLSQIRSITSNAVDLVRKRNEGYKGNEDSCITCITIGATKGPQSQQKQIMTIVIPADVVTIEDWEELYNDTAVCCDIITIYNREWKEKLLKQQHQKRNKQNFLVPHYLFPHGDHRNFDVTETTITFKNDILKFIFEEEEKPNNSPQCFSWKLFLNDREDEVTSYRSNETEMKALTCDNSEFTKALEKYKVMSAYPPPTTRSFSAPPGRGSSSSNWRAKDEPLTQSRPVTASNPESADTIRVTVNLTRNINSNDPSIKATIIVSSGKNSIVTPTTDGQLIDVKTCCAKFAEKGRKREWYVFSFVTKDGTTNLANSIRNVWTEREEFSEIAPHLLYCDSLSGSTTTTLRNYRHLFPHLPSGTVSFINLAHDLERQKCHINVHSHLKQKKALHDSRCDLEEDYKRDFYNKGIKPDKFLPAHYDSWKFKKWLKEEESAVAFKYPIIRMGFSTVKMQKANGERSDYPTVLYYTNKNGATSHHKYLHNSDGSGEWEFEQFDLPAYKTFISELKTKQNRPQ